MSQGMRRNPLFRQQRQLPVLIFDEAHHLRNEVLEDLRLLTNFTMDSEPRLCLLLIGLSELRKRLSMRLHQSLSQRLVIRHHFGALSRTETERYLLHRLLNASAADKVQLFEANAIEMMHAQARVVTLEHMTQATEEVQS